MDAWRFFFLLLTFQLTNAACNGGERIFLRINETKTINSPNYPLNYPNNANCSWTFETEHSIRGRWDEYYVSNYVLLVRLTIYELDINNNDGYCKKDYLSFNGWLKLCKAGTESFLLDDYRKTVKFISDQQQTGKGFQLTVTAVERCGGLRNITAGRYQWLTAPTYPRPLPRSVYCKWQLKTTNGDLIAIKSFGQSCRKGYYSYASFKPSADSRTKRVYLCSNTKNQTIWTFPSPVEVHFYMYIWSNVNFNLRVGTCGGHLYMRGYDRWLTPPEFGNSPYPSAVRCQWQLNTHNTDLIKVTDTTQNDCSGFTLRAWSVSNPSHVEDLCQTDGNRSATLASPMIVAFVMTSQNVVPKFIVRVASMPLPNHTYAACNGGERIILRINETKTINSPNYPLNYPNNADCSWTFETERSIRHGDEYYIYNYVLLLRLTIYELDTNNNDRYCKKDFVHFVGQTNRCKAGTESFLLYDYRKTVKFRSDQQQTGKGFQLTVTAVEACGGQRNITADRYLWLTAPTYPHSYPLLVYCEWHLTATNGYLIEIKSFGKTDSCFDDLNAYVSFTTPVDSSIQKVDLCWDNKKQTSWTFPSSVKVHFEMRFNVNFNLRVGTLPDPTYAACNGGERIILKINETKSINSPNYPLNYPNNANCSWTFETERSIRYVDNYVKYNYVLLIRLTIYELDGNNDGRNCKKDYLSFDRWYRLCKAKTDSFLLYDYRRTVKFRSDQQQTGKGFQLTVTAVEHCGGQKNITADRYQWLTAPTFPRPYPSSVSCEWQLKTTNGNLIGIKSFGKTDSCRKDYHSYVSFKPSADSRTKYVFLCSDKTNQTSWTFPSSVIVHFDMYIWSNVNFNLRVGTLPAGP